ncbi:SDR family oxidoreductase [Fictibacillus sp. KIGAM418]|uniref:SDR family oxidoreductase n=1 Tax=Fictibacillus marinisediminis TaxID=2878389 RepID=A0A9X1X7Q4_9BACL|nr:SDR family oxidoreductase [Fictibacillus marinisediminis]MCK6255617.1 SDR family oxidoreductase [Fictibacillus marinisediminis]
MKVFLVGANGQIGRKLVELLGSSSEHSVRAMIRNPEQANELEKLGAQTVVANLEGSVSELAEAVKESDAIIFSAGSGGSTGSDKTLLVDLDGAAKMVEAAEQAGVDRFVIVSALQAHNRENWNEKLRPYYAAKHYADKILESSSLNYTIVRPGGLLNEPGTGKVEASKNLGRASIPREDVAQTVLAALTEEHTFKRSFDLISGDHSIPDALKNL